MKGKLIGLSLSFCVADIVRGTVEFEKVDKIVTATAAGPAEWDGLLDEYKRIYWDFNPDECERVARKLMTEGKIEQPRLEGKEARNIAAGHWLVNGVQTRL